MDDRITLRFLATPQDATVGSRMVAAGSMLEWIDRAGFACATAWSSSYCVTAYVGNVHFTRTIDAGDLIQAHARIIHTGRTSMQVLVVVEAADVETREFSKATHCILVFVAVDADGGPREVPAWEPRTDDDRAVHASAQARVGHRRDIRDAMMVQRYTSDGTTPETTFRFLAQPAVANYGGNAHGGTVMRWIHETAFGCAAGWSSEAAVVVYTGGVHFFHPVRIGHLVQLDARLIHTTARTMHIAVRVRSGSPTDPGEHRLTTQCLAIFVDRGADGRAVPVRPLELRTAEDRRLDAHAAALIEARAAIPPLVIR